jgi:hypothetical protein
MDLLSSADRGGQSWRLDAEARARVLPIPYALPLQFPGCPSSVFKGRLACTPGLLLLPYPYRVGAVNHKCLI